MKITSAFRKISAMRNRVKVVQGSQGASKTYSILQRWILLSAVLDTYETCSIITSTMPALRAGAIKDFENICLSEGLTFSRTKTPQVFKLNGWTFEFYSVDKEEKGRGGRRDRLFLNEANRLEWKVAQQLISRTHKEVILDFNPVAKFWGHENFVDVNGCDFIKLTYKDNEFLPQAEVEAIERHAPWGSVPDENYWRVFGLGDVGFVEGQVFKNYQKYDALPENEEYQYSIGVDFGHIDPMSAVSVAINHKKMEIYWRELFYASEASIEDLAKGIKENEPNYRNIIALCDHSPKLIQMLHKNGVSSRGANKKGGLIADIRLLKQYTIFVHKDSSNLIMEMDAYKYQEQHGHFNDYPDQRCSEHAIDAARYGSIYYLRY